jgi:hypothetical protein
MNVSALSEARFQQRARQGKVFGALSIKPFEQSRPWFAADAGLMQIQGRDGAVSRCAEAVRQSTTDHTGK